MQATHEVDPHFREPVGDGVVRRHVIAIPRKIRDNSAASENLSFGQQGRVFEGAAAGAVMARVRVDPPSEAPLVPPPADAAAAARPVFAHWYRANAVHQLEREGNADFFSGESPARTEALYMEYRNALIAAYRAAPRRRLELRDARALLVGDAAAIARLWRFLDSRGLINFEAPPPRVRPPAA